MQKILRTLGSFAAVGLFVFILAGCHGGPNEDQLKMLEETKSAALSAESSQSDCQSEKASLESQVAKAKQKVADLKQEKADVSNRLSAM